MPSQRPSPAATPPVRTSFTHVVFDFDGTLSWLRHGWPGIMAGLMRPRLPRLPGEGEEAVERLLADIILGLNGSPTILQMTRFALLVRERGGPAIDPEALRRDYQERLDREIAARLEAVNSGRAAPDAFVVYGARAFLERLSGAGLALSIVSSTIESRVREEAAALGIAGFFAGRIHGCVGDPRSFSKRAVFARLLAEDGISGARLLACGDGPVEIAEAKRLGGLAVAVCSDEEVNGSGICDPGKRRQLLAAGADLAIPDYRAAWERIAGLGGRP